MAGDHGTGRLLPYGDRAVLIEVPDLRDALALHDELQGGRGLADVVVGARTVLLVAESTADLPAVRTLAQAALSRSASAGSPGPARSGSRPGTGTPPPTEHVVAVPVHYDGEDLREVASLTGLAAHEVVDAHTGTPWRVAFAGFAPGFAYLVDGDPRLRVPRRASPRARVPAGAVGLADEFSGVYPRASPGGWQLLGHTELDLWDLDRDPPALLRPGLWVRFTDADAAP